MELALFAAVILKVIDFIRLLAAMARKEIGHLSAVLTQLSAWLGGVIMVALGAHAALTQTLTFPGTSTALGALDGPSQVLLGLAVASIASTLVDLKQAVDQSDSAAKPALLDSPHDTVVVD